MDTATMTVTATNANNRTKEALETLKREVEALTNSGEWTRYLRFLSRFHRYSVANIIMIMAQRPTATRVASYTTWKRLGGHVRKGAKSIHVFAPHTYSELDADGNEVKKLGFHLAPVFDTADVDGVDKPEICHDLTGDVSGYSDMIAGLCELAPCPVFTENISEPGCHGYYSPINNKIVLSYGLSQLQTIKTLVHEIAHSLLHNPDGEEKHAGRYDAEVQAESVAYAVCDHYGLDTGSYSFGYITGWASGQPVQTIKKSLDCITRTADYIIDGLDKYMTKGDE